MTAVESILRRYVGVRKLQGDGVGGRVFVTHHEFASSLRNLDAALEEAMDEIQPDDFLNRFRSNSSECLNNTYL